MTNAESFAVVDPQVDPDQAKKARAELRRTGDRWGVEHAARVAALTEDLVDGIQDATPPEQTLLKLAAGTTAVAESLQRSQLQLAERLERLVDAPQLLVAVAKGMAETTRIHGATTRNASELLQAAGTLRAQRRLVDQRERKSWHADVRGAALGQTGRDSVGRPAAAN